MQCMYMLVEMLVLNLVPITMLIPMLMLIIIGLDPLHRRAALDLRESVATWVRTFTLAGLNSDPEPNRTSAFSSKAPVKIPQHGHDIGSIDLHGGPGWRLMPAIPADRALPADFPGAVPVGRWTVGGVQFGHPTRDLGAGALIRWVARECRIRVGTGQCDCPLS